MTNCPMKQKGNLSWKKSLKKVCKVSKFVEESPNLGQRISSRLKVIISFRRNERRKLISENCFVYSITRKEKKTQHQDWQTIPKELCFTLSIFFVFASYSSKCLLQLGFELLLPFNSNFSPASKPFGQNCIFT